MTASCHCTHSQPLPGHLADRNHVVSLGNGRVSLRKEESLQVQRATVFSGCNLISLSGFEHLGLTIHLSMYVYSFMLSLIHSFIITKVHCAHITIQISFCFVFFLKPQELY